MSSLTVEEDQKWLPTHVQVTVLRGRGLRGKGKHGTSDAYTIIQLGKEKYSTGVVEKTTEPEWREECSFELQPGVLESGGRSAYPAGSNELVLTVMHRALIGPDVFLGQAVIQLDKLFHETKCVKNEWYRLNSKTGKKEKERGDIQVTIQFTRNNLTASMYDLVMKDKSASTFTKLKERMKGKRRSSDEDSSSAVLPGGYGSLYKMRQRLPSDGGGEEDYEDDEGGEVRRSKMRTFFLRGKLRKSSDTRSSTSLGSESSESSSRGGSLSPTAGISVVVSDLSNSPSNSSNLTADNSPEHTANTSPKSSSLRGEFDDEAGEITIVVPQHKVCVNGSHAYDVQPLDPGSGKRVDSLGLGLLQKSLPTSMSLQNLSPHTTSTTRPKSPAGDGRRWSFDKPDEEEKAAIAAALEKSGPMMADEDERLGQAGLHREAASSSSSSAVDLESQGKKQRRNLFSPGKSESSGRGPSQSKDESEHAPAATEEKHRGWFGSKDSHSKLSLVVSPKLESSTDPHPPPLPARPHPTGPPVDPATLVSPLHHTNPFCHSQSTSPPMSPCNPFFSSVQHNPFYEDMLTAKPLNSPLPPLPYLSSARPPISQLFPQAINTQDSIVGADPRSKVPAKAEKRPLPPIPTEEEKPSNKKSANPFTSAGELDSEWDESFEAFAAGRLQSPEDLTTDCKTQQNTPSDHPLEHCNNKGAFPLMPAADQNINVNEALHHQPCTEFAFEAHKAITVAANTNTYHFDTFAQFLETIPEHASFESENTVLNSPDDSPKLAACTETNQANNTTNTVNLTDTSTHQPLSHALAVKLNSSSPDPSSSGLGSSAEEDFLSCVSSYSDKFSASSSSEEAEAQTLESSILSLEQSSESAVVKHLKDSDIADKSSDLSSVDVAKRTPLEGKDGDEKVDMVGFEALVSSLIGAREIGTASEDNEVRNVSKPEPKSDISLPGSDGKIADLDSVRGSSEPQLSVITHQQHPVNPAVETGTEAEDTRLWELSEPEPKSNVSPQSVKGLGELPGSAEDVSKALNDSSIPTPDQKLFSTQPALHIITSSPDPSSSDQFTENTSSGGQDTDQQSPIPFGLLGDFLNTSSIAVSPSKGLDETLLHTPLSDKSSSSFLQSLYVSTDSQAYQTCVSGPSSKFSSGSEPNETLDSLNLTLCEEQGLNREAVEAPLGKWGSGNVDRSSSEEMCQKSHIEESFTGALDKTATIDSMSTLEVHDCDYSTLFGELSESKATAEASLDKGDSAIVCEAFSEDILQKNHISKEISQEMQCGADTNQKHQSREEDSQYGKSRAETSQEFNQKKQSSKEISKDNHSSQEVNENNQYSEDTCKNNQSIKDTSHKNQAREECNQKTESSQEYQPRGEYSLKSQSSQDISQKSQSSEGISQINQCSEDISQRNQTKEEINEQMNQSGDSFLQKYIFEENICQSGEDTSQENQSKEPSIQASLSAQDISQVFQHGVEANQSKDQGTKFYQDNQSSKEISQNYQFREETNHETSQTSQYKAEISQKNQLQEPSPKAWDMPGTFEPAFEVQDAFGLEVHPAASTDSNRSNNPSQNIEGAPEEFLDDPFLNWHQAQGVPLLRSHSEGTLTPAFEDLLFPSFGSDPGAIQDPSSAQPSPEVPSLTSFPPSLTPDRSASPVAFSSLPFLDNAKASSGTAREQTLLETNPQRQAGSLEENSPHPVKPLTTAMQAEEKRTEGRSVLEKLKSTINPGRSSQISEQETERRKSLTEGAGSYYHLTHSELVALLVQREAELERQKTEFERQKILLAKREVELKKLKPQVRDLEDYIDTLLVRIMEQKPTLLQVRSKLK